MWVCVCVCVCVCTNDPLKTSEAKLMQHALYAVSTQLLAAWRTPSPGCRGVHPHLAIWNMLQAEQLLPWRIPSTSECVRWWLSYPLSSDWPLHHRCAASPSPRVGSVWLGPGEAAQPRLRPHTHAPMTWSGGGSHRHGTAGFNPQRQHPRLGWT